MNNDQMKLNKKLIEESNVKITSEQKFRSKVLKTAKDCGCEMEARQIMQRYDNLLKNCTNEKERQEIAVMGIAELHRLMGVQSALNVNDVEIIPAQK